MNQRNRKTLVVPSVIAIMLSVVFFIDSSQSQMHSYGGMDRWDPSHLERDMWGQGMMGQGQMHRMQRHWTFMHSGVPSEYRGKRNPLPQTPEIVKAGGELYQKQCSGCHGTQGLGNGVISNSLNPSPALLAYLIQMPMTIDSYLLWSISEGGKEFGTSMPAFKDGLSDQEIWQIVTYMRAGFVSSTQSN
jgi:mono/diheme cytochrome c family protein